MAAATRQPYSPFGRMYSGLDERLAEQVCALLEELKLAGLLANDTDTISAGQLIFNNLNMMFTAFVKVETMTVAQALAAIKRQLRLVLIRTEKRQDSWRQKSSSGLPDASVVG